MDRALLRCLYSSCAKHNLCFFTSYISFFACGQRKKKLYHHRTTIIHLSYLNFRNVRPLAFLSGEILNRIKGQFEEKNTPYYFRHFRHQNNINMLNVKSYNRVPNCTPYDDVANGNINQASLILDSSNAKEVWSE